MPLRPTLRRPVRLAGLALPLALVAAACGGGDKTPSAPPVPQLAKLTIAQTLDTLSELASRQLTVTGTDKDGKPMSPPTLAWLSSDTNVVSVTSSGSATARQPGSATLTAQSGGVSTTLALRVVQVPITDILVRLVGALSPDTLMIGTSATLIGEPRDLGGRPLLGRKVTFAVVDSTRGSIDAAGLVTGRSVGVLSILARVDSVERRQSIVVRPTYAAKIAMRLADPKRLKDTLWVGLKDSAIVSFTDSAGLALAPTPFRPVSYTTDDTKIAVVDQLGRVIPVAPGQTTLRATGDRLVVAAPLRVVMAPITSLVSAPDTVRVLPGETTQIRPILIDGAGLRVASLTGHTLRYDATTPSIATVDAQGVVHGVVAGTGTVRITSDRGAVDVPVRVLGPAGDKAFRVTVRFVGPEPSKDVAAAFAAAKSRWEGVIRESIGSATYAITAGTCGAGETAHDELITDVLIYARIDSIDGPSNILGSAGPCIIRRLSTGKTLPLIGRMTFDSADMNLMATTGRLVNVITHEMGHVLGIGTLWSLNLYNGGQMAVQSGGDPRYLAGGGVAASAGMGFTGSSLGVSGIPVLDNVPLENTGGSGTAGSHWRRSTFGNELMNGFAGTGAQPLSLLTVMAMADFGYIVNTSAAESWGTFFTTGPTSSLGAYFGEPAMRINERLLSPEAILEGGRVRKLGAPAARQ